MITERWWDIVAEPKDEDQTLKHNILDGKGDHNVPDNGNGNESLHHRKVCYNRNPFFIKSEKLFKKFCKMELLPREISCYWISFVTNPQDILRLMGTSKEVREMVISNIKEIEDGYVISVKLLLLFRNLERCQSLVRTRTVEDLIPLSYLPKLQGLKIISSYKPFIKLIDKYKPQKLIRLQWCFTESFLKQYTKVYTLEDGIVRTRIRKLEPNFNFELVNFNRKLPINNLGLYNSTLYLKTSELDQYYIPIINIISEKYMQVKKLISNVSLSDFASNNSSNDYILTGHQYITKNNNSIMKDVFKPIHYYDNLEKLKVSIKPKVVPFYIEHISDSLDYFIRFYSDLFEDNLSIKREFKLDVPLLTPMVEKILAIFPKLQLISIIDFGTVNDITLTISQLSLQVPKVKLYAMPENGERYREFFSNFSNVKVVSFVNPEKEMDCRFF